MERVRQDGGGVSVGEIQKLQRDPLLIGSDAEGGEEHVDEAGVAGAFLGVGVLEGG